VSAPKIKSRQPVIDGGSSSEDRRRRVKAARRRGDVPAHEGERCSEATASAFLILFAGRGLAALGRNP
jgi:hypothetical protein